tara:strand:- start:782 stop:1510 length:729 start_codon:yes stop_codon:yes gene_type:complete
MNTNLTYFISDLHLSESTTLLNKAFDAFIAYCHAYPPKHLYILGDLFDYYLGFDVAGVWGAGLAAKIASLSELGISLFFLPGNRDFLIDKDFLRAAKLTRLNDPCVISLADKQITLSHGDALCTNDKYHQRFRSLSQSYIVKSLFLCLPKSYRVRVAKKIRDAGRERSLNEHEIMPVDEVMISCMMKFKTDTLIHGHIHRPMVRCIQSKLGQFKQVVLPDWRTKAEFVVFDETTQQFQFDDL